MQPELGGCVDIDECSNEKSVCKNNQFCVNSEGSFSCLGKLHYYCKLKANFNWFNGVKKRMR